MVTWIAAWRHERWLAWLLLVPALLLIASTIYLRYHYVIDVIAGLALALGVSLVAPWLERWWKSLRQLALPR